MPALENKPRVAASMLAQLQDLPAAGAMAAIADDEVDGDPGDGAAEINCVDIEDPGDGAAIGDEEVDGDQEDDYEYPTSIGGVHVTMESHGVDKGLRVTCPHHANCRCYRSVRLDVDIFGRRAAEFFIQTWLAHPEKPDHNTWKPSRSDIRSFLASL